MCVCVCVCVCLCVCGCVYACLNPIPLSVCSYSAMLCINTLLVAIKDISSKVRSSS